MDFRQLFKLRLVVAALGESQRLDWWNSGVLTGTGEFLFQQGFPRSSPFAQTRAGFRVVQLACDEALAIQPTPGGPITCHLFRLTPQLEDAFENERNRWLDEPQEWAACFQAAWALSAEQWPQALVDLADLDPAALDWARNQTPQTAKALRLDAPFEINQGHIERLAAGFVCDPMPSLTPAALVQYLRSAVGQTLLDKAGQGTAVAFVPMGEVESLLVVIPHASELQRAEALEQESVALSREVEELSRKLQRLSRQGWMEDIPPALLAGDQGEAA